MYILFSNYEVLDKFGVILNLVCNGGSCSKMFRHCAKTTANFFIHNCNIKSLVKYIKIKLNKD